MRPAKSRKTGTGRGSRTREKLSPPPPAHDLAAFKTPGRRKKRKENFSAVVAERLERSFPGMVRKEKRLVKGRRGAAALVFWKRVFFRPRSYLRIVLLNFAFVNEPVFAAGPDRIVRIPGVYGAIRVFSGRISYRVERDGLSGKVGFSFTTPARHAAKDLRLAGKENRRVESAGSRKGSTIVSCVRALK